MAIPFRFSVSHAGNGARGRRRAAHNVGQSAGRRHYVAGFSLIEVLVSLLIFSFGMLGAIGLQARTVQISVQAGDRSRAALLANEIVSEMWLRRTTSLPTTVVTAWNTRVADTATMGLPAGAGTVSAADADGVVTVTVTWRPPALHSTDPSNTYATQVVLQ